jgi:predicted methyltransferase
VAWLRVIGIGVAKLIVKATAPIAVLIVDRQDNPIWGVADATDLGYKNVAFRNAGHNFVSRPQVEYTQTGNELAQKDWTLEKLDGFQWRMRKNKGKAWMKAGEYVSLRMTWGKARNKGKKEFYVGWTMNESKTMRVTFFQFRPF